MPSVRPLSKNRELIGDLLLRAKKFHATCSSVHEFDVTELLARQKSVVAAGGEASFNACLIKATSLVLAKYRGLNCHLFHGIWGRRRIVDFDDIACNLIVIRRIGGELMLVPLVIERSNERSIAEITRQIAQALSAPAETLPAIRAQRQLAQLPRVVTKWFSYKCRSDHRFYRRYFGTFGLSSLIAEGPGGVIEGKVGVVTHAFANTCTAFLPTSVEDRTVLVDHEAIRRKILTITFLGDHYLIDGHDGLLAMRYLGRLLAHPTRLDLESVPQRADS